MKPSNKIVFVVLNLLGVAAFVWPLLIGSASTTEASAHVYDAPAIIALAMPLIVLITLAEAKGRGGSRMIALLAALVAIGALLRFPKGPSGEGFVLAIPILTGWVLGVRTGFAVGGLTIFASAVVGAGVGPWLPFQMFATAWVGAGAGLLKTISPRRGALGIIVAYGVVASLVFGAVMTLWFWPFLDVRGVGAFVAGAGLVKTLKAFFSYYVVTSLGWDVGRAILATAPSLLLLYAPMMHVLTRADLRLNAQVLATPTVATNFP